VRHGYQPEREVQTGIGAIVVRRPRVRDRHPDAGGRIRFTSSILPPYLRRAKSVEELLPWLYLKGISTGDFGEALAALVGPDAPGLSATTIARLKAAWAEDYERWRRRDLSAKRYFWADGVSQLTSARIREASMWTTSAVAIFASKHAATVRLKIIRNRSSPQRWRRWVRVE